MRQDIKKFFLALETKQFLRILAIAVVLIAVFSLVAINFLDADKILLIDLAILILFIFCEIPFFGFCVMALFYPFVNWQFVLGSVNLPYVDLLALILFLAMAIRALVDYSLRTTPRKITIRQIFPGIIFAGCFVLSSALSIINNEFFWSAVKYLLRPILFFYLMFVVLPYHLIDNKERLKIVLRVMLAVGLLVTALGICAILYAPGQGWGIHRAVPFSFGGFNPLGGNQNAVAEVLVAMIPIAFILFLMSEKIKQRGWYVLAIMFMVLVLLLTFSRSGWLALLVELLILFFIKYRHRVNKYVVLAIVLLLIVIPLILYFSVWSKIDWIETSNANRLLLSGIAFNSFLDHPIIGNGLNTFQQIVGRTFVYRVEFGDPLESHGFLQKILTESGLLGIISFGLLLGYMLVRYVRSYLSAKFFSHQMIIACFLMMFAGIAVFELFSTSYYLANAWLPIGIGLSGARLYEEE